MTAPFLSYHAAMAGLANMARGDQSYRDKLTHLRVSI
ncbi:hypothetical protein SAMN05443248_0553 [Bradyrhizobium erythrophlei]|uniref:Uncharacterized protein n=1 Tax=Bradyrhizobium erythrophlei TaxID=1437360 RepID=A0A1M5HNG1_9BRAD|nr:hypothetical protein SAMN05443248_0553 [Bradyrhizobium erythrophlei]